MKGKFGQLKTDDPLTKCANQTTVTCLMNYKWNRLGKRKPLPFLYHQTQNIEYCTLIIHFLFTTGYKFEKRVSFKNLPNPTKSIKKKKKKKEQKQISIYRQCLPLFSPHLRIWSCKSSRDLFTSWTLHKDCRGEMTNEKINSAGVVWRCQSFRRWSFPCCPSQHPTHHPCQQFFTIMEIAIIEFILAV